MILIDDKLISDAIIEEQFACNLNACKGACCWEGDYGAPLEDDEVEKLRALYPKIKPFLTLEGIEAIQEHGTHMYVKQEDENATTLIENNACAYMTKNEHGMAQCGIEQAYKAEEIDFKKPISCHLYPIRIKELKDHEALNYDVWDICSAACDRGKKEKIPVYVFLKEALIRKYGEDFYEQLSATATFIKNNEK